MNDWEVWHYLLLISRNKDYCAISAEASHGWQDAEGRAQISNGRWLVVESTSYLQPVVDVDLTLRTWIVDEFSLCASFCHCVLIILSISAMDPLLICSCKLTETESDVARLPRGKRSSAENSRSCQENPVHVVQVIRCHLNCNAESIPYQDPVDRVYGSIEVWSFLGPVNPRLGPWKVAYSDPDMAKWGCLGLYNCLDWMIHSNYHDHTLVPTIRTKIEVLGLLVSDGGDPPFGDVRDTACLYLNY